MPKIKDYAIIGNGRSVALISNNGSLEWLCWPRFDSPSLFAALLDQEKGGKWKINPTSSFTTKRQYIDGTNVLQTSFYTNTGSLSITDFMVGISEEEKGRSLQPEQEIIRRCQCDQGEVEIAIEFSPKPDFCRTAFVLKDAGVLGIRLEVGRELFTLKGNVNWQIRDNVAYATVKLKANEKCDFSLTYTAEAPAVVAPATEALISQKLSQTTSWWRNWVSGITYQGPYKSEVIRSTLVLKLLGYAPSGTFAAAPTTSLPQKIGGDLNWDYRFCWLRDAAFTVRALFGLGFKEEAEAFVSWLLHSTRLTFPQLRVLYDVYGEDIENDKELPTLKGFENSPPVRIGNGVRSFFELDVYGEVIEAVTHFVREGGSLDSETRKMLIGFGKYVCKNWQKPDTGIWEKMIPLRHYTHSKLMCWVALDRLLEMNKRGKLENIPSNFKECHQQIRQAIEEKGWNTNVRSYTQEFNGQGLDSSLLAMPLYGFDEASSTRMQQTLKAILDKLSPKPGLIYRYEKSTEEGEATFGLCGFWYAEFLVKSGKSSEAHDIFKQMLTYANDVGLFSEEIDANSGDALGNYPQAFTHVGLINTALSLEQREKK